MTSIERAKRFLKTGARAIALTVVPLASVQASTLILDPSTCIAVPSGSGNFVITPCSVAQLPAGPDGVVGIKIFGEASTTSMFSGFLALNMTTQGTASGSGGSVAISYDFTLSDTFSNAMNWDVFFDVAGDLTDASGQASGVSTGGTITGNFNVDASSIGNAFEYVLHVEAIEEASAGNDTLTIDVPPNSIDANPMTSSIPEPATWSLFGSALACLPIWKLRRKQKP